VTSTRESARPGEEPRPCLAPQPFMLYVHDDLTDIVRARHGAQSEVWQLTRALMALISGSRKGVRVLTLEEQLRSLSAQGPHTAFPLTIGIGRAGQRVARQVHLRTGWFPVVARVDVAREEVAGGGYRLASLGEPSIDAQLEVARGYARLAVIDDTVFSGFTMNEILQRLSSLRVPGIRVFCLRGVGETLARLRAEWVVTAGFEAPGRLLEEVSFINASGLVLRGSIRREGLPPLAFFERPEWIEAWFPHGAGPIVEQCRALNALLEPPGEDPARKRSSPPSTPVVHGDDGSSGREAASR
jgi:hypothetical protein